MNFSLPRTTTLAAIFCGVFLASKPAGAEEKVVFDFKDNTSLKGWAQYLPDNPKVPGHKEPVVKIELARDPQAPDRLGLKLTYAGGKFPAVATRSPLEDWTPYKTFKAEVTAPRRCVAAFRVVNVDDERHHGWAKIALLEKGRNVVIDYAPAYGQQFGPQIKKGMPTQFEVLMYAPHEGESLWVHNIRLSSEAPQTITPYHGDHVRMGDVVRPWTPVRSFAKVEKIRVLGLDTSVSSVAEFGKQMTAKWTPQQDRTVGQVEADFQALHQRLSKDHPRAVAAIFRTGQKGYDPAAPDKVFAGWACTGTSAHGPNAVHLEIMNSGHTPATSDRMEVSLRGRPDLMRCDLSSIPRGSTILAARLVLVRATPVPKDWDNRRPYFVAEFCTRPWKETEVNVFEYARDRFWQELLGMNWHGDDPDFLPMIIAQGPSQPTTSAWDFTEAVKWWTDGRQTNHGFTLCNAVYGGSIADGLIAYTSRAKDVTVRPAMMVIYEPKP